MIEIRRLCAEDMPKFSRLMSVVFNRRHDFSAEEKENKKPDPLDPPPEWALGAFEGDKLLSTMRELKYLVRFDNNSVPMSGIASVGTLPEARKGGLVRKLYENLLPEASERGVIFSTLCPFSHSYYRQFGYEASCTRIRLTVPMREFSKMKISGDFVQIFPGDDVSALKEIHRAYISDLNQGICRDYWKKDLAWKVFTRDDPYATGNYLYLWKNDRGIPRGYIKFRDTKNRNDEHIMSVQELLFLDRDSLYGVLSFTGVMAAQYREFQWLMPNFINPADFIGNLWDAEQQIVIRDMTRVVNMKSALEKMRRPEGEGSYVMEIDDEIVKSNKGRYLVEYDPKESRVTLTRKKPDIHCDIPTASQLIIGYRTLENALRGRQSGLEVYGNRETLDKVFTLRRQHVTEYF